MSILEVEGLSMSFDDKQLYKDASFRLNKEDHMGIIGQIHLDQNSDGF